MSAELNCEQFNTLGKKVTMAKAFQHEVAHIKNNVCNKDLEKTNKVTSYILV